MSTSFDDVGTNAKPHRKTMARISIPNSEYSILRELAELPEDSFTSLVTGLSEIAPEVHQLDLIPLLTRRVPTIDASDLKAFLRTLFSLYRMLGSKGRTPGDLADAVRETIQQEKPRNFPTEKLQTLGERLVKLLTIGRGIAIVAKARNVISDQASIFCGARFLSDVRPVFTDDPETISAASVVHSLNLQYHEHGGHKEFFVALSNPDLQLLKREIERAEKKAAAMKSMIEKAGMVYLEGE
jgi:hypothetical protein